MLQILKNDNYTNNKKRSKSIPNKITNIQTNVLLALAKYQYLTFSQMMQIGVGGSYYQYIHKHVLTIRERRKPLLACHNYSTPQPKRGKVESLYFLTEYGKRFLMEELNLPEREIRQPSSRAVLYKDYHHRKGTVTFQIYLNQFAKKQGYELPFFDTYFERSKSGKVFYAKTRIEYKDEFMIPDAAFSIMNGEQEKHFLFEMHRGEDTLRLLRQVHQHAKFMTVRATHGKYNISVSKAYSVLILFELINTKNAFLNRAKSETSFQQIQQYFLLKSMEELESDFGRRWLSLFGEEKNIF